MILTKIKYFSDSNSNDLQRGYAGIQRRKQGGSFYVKKTGGHDFTAKPTTVCREWNQRQCIVTGATSKTISSTERVNNAVWRKPEVLAPAGGWPQLIAAVENGADAVYFGVTDFNARARADNFTSEELPDVMQYLHERNVKGYLVLNVLVFDDELKSLARRAQAARNSSVDAVIVQDIGVVEVIRKVAPGLSVHGSTQMTVTSADSLSYASGLGIERVVVGRELSLDDIKQISMEDKYGQAEVEVFVHGALCVSYSGQCFSSEAWGGRSANRGQCAQACRLQYGLIVDGMLKEIGDEKYLLSPQDLAAIDLIPELIEAGVVSLKIEGTYKYHGV